MNICLFSQEEITSPLSLQDERARHILSVLHKKEGDSFSAGIIGGMAGTAAITKIGRTESSAPNGKKYKDGYIFFTFTPETDGKHLLPLAMIIGFPRPIQLRRLLRDMASLGVSEIHLTGTELGEKSYLQSGIATSGDGRRFLLEGAAQAASTRIPSLFMHSSLKECLAATDLHCPCFALDNKEASRSLSEALQKKPEKAAAAIGSERGWTDSERNLLKENGFELLRMGSRVLRTETAATASAALILGAMGLLN